MEKKPKEPKTPTAGFASINEDLIQNILKRIPALSFASAACVSKSWNQNCRRILSRPKLASAFSLNPDQKIALEEVVDKVLSEPIRPQFAIANVVGSEVDMSGKLDFLAAKLGSKIPIIVSCASGMMGRDAVTDEYKEVMIEDFWVDGASNSGFGVVLTVGFLPGLKVDAIPLLRPRKAQGVAMVDNFVMDIRNYAASVSGSTSPVLIIMFGSEKTDQKPVVEKLDLAMSRETTVVGDERAKFVYRSGIESRNVYGSNGEYFSDAVALVFARDREKPSGAGEIHFHSALSTGVSATGPRYKAVSVKEIESETGLSTSLTVRREGEQEILGGQRIIDDIINELGNQTKLFIGVSYQRKCFSGSEKPRPTRSLAIHEVMGADTVNLYVNGVGIKTGDYFRLYHSDPSTASSSSRNVSKNFRNLKLDWSFRSCQLHVGGGVGNEEVIGGFVFACWGRGESFFGHSNVDSSPLLDNFPEVPMAGIFTYGEIGRGFSILNEDELGQEDETLHFCSHVYSTVYLLVSYTPALLQIARTAFANLTTEDWVHRVNVYDITQIPNDVPINVTLNCSCGDKHVSKDYGLFMTYPLRPGETLASLAAESGVPADLLVRYNLGTNLNAGSGIVYVPATDQTGNYPPLKINATGISSRVIAGISVAGVAGAFFFASCFYFGLYRRRVVMASLLPEAAESPYIHHRLGSSNILEKTSETAALVGSPGLTGITVDKSVEFSYEELAKATDDFNIANKIGQGGFGIVYYAELRGEKAAIKKMDMQASKEFLAELKVLTHVHHLNLSSSHMRNNFRQVRLIGYCVESSLFLVYEFIENGNLSHHLRSNSGKVPLSWPARVQIALDSARGLEYIHEHTVPVYIHRDVKSANILIDKNFRGKVADFGLTRLTEVGSASLHTRLVGTFGYMPPEYAQYGDVSAKIDVYAFGVVLYELISAKEAVVKTNEFITESKGLVALFEDVLRQQDPRENLPELVDPRLGDDYPLDSVCKMAQLARACTQENPQVRPSMRSIVVALMTLSSSSEDWDVGSVYENQAIVNLMAGR
ncbi:unnamed protein product [Dovyalis caffra]|uniref:non-specific serine/threonine protein kinase n=1 Tax=Dovyalis caffra TaxID=77055 RepID=A0AAV1SJ23_9ROSI|nr:unnamed protein product [Dovyalis caffra]